MVGPESWEGGTYRGRGTTAGHCCRNGGSPGRGQKSGESATVADRSTAITAWDLCVVGWNAPGSGGRDARSLPEAEEVAGGSTTAAAVRQAGFDIVPNPTGPFANHVRLIHPNGVAGFTDANLAILSQAFSDTAGC
jgi:hypothetical protein